MLSEVKLESGELVPLIVDEKGCVCISQHQMDELKMFMVELVKTCLLDTKEK